MTADKKTETEYIYYNAAGVEMHRSRGISPDISYTYKAVKVVKIEREFVGTWEQVRSVESVVKNRYGHVDSDYAQTSTETPKVYTSPVKWASTFVLNSNVHVHGVFNSSREAKQFIEDNINEEVKSYTSWNKVSGGWTAKTETVNGGFFHISPLGMTHAEVYEIMKGE